MKPIVHMGLKVQPRIANNEASIELQKYGFTFLLETMGVNLFDKEKGEKKKKKKREKVRFPIMAWTFHGDRIKGLILRRLNAYCGTTTIHEM